MDEPGESEESWKRIIAKGAARGLFVWASYLIAGILVSWSAFLIAGRDIWSTFPVFHGAHAGPIALIFLVFFPQTWISLFYILGLPALYFLAGQKMALVVAVSRVARGRSRRLARWLASASFPVCEAIAQLPGAPTVRAASSRLLEAIDQPRVKEGGESTATLWLLRRLTKTLKIAEICATATFLEQVRTAPPAAHTTLEDTLDSRLQDLTHGRRFVYLWVLIAVTVVITVTRQHWLAPLATGGS